ncbi:hypothetical protein GCM10009865_54420 [Aeromicrobium ponti]|uniref:Uncharacterized protein n=1 Tax=Cytobacillus oceanisediminis TaxID=665099 RepID=A0A562J3V0_9BACI|nr:hypothetical protein [Cytobacillus oceanisediminis]TWH77858.1 hypothetical protein IQ19_05563 [Cytobacillus oceanisediminis]
MSNKEDISIVEIRESFRNSIIEEFGDTVGQLILFEVDNSIKAGKEIKLDNGEIKTVPLEDVWEELKVYTNTIKTYFLDLNKCLESCEAYFNETHKLEVEFHFEPNHSTKEPSITDETLDNGNNKQLTQSIKQFYDLFSKLQIKEMR